MPDRNRVVFVISDEGLGGVAPFGKEIRAMGMTPVLITGKQPDPQLQAWREIYERVFISDDPYNTATLIETARSQAGNDHIAGLFSCYDGLVIPAAKAAEQLGLPHPALDGLNNSRNKYAGRIMTKRKAVHTPRFLLATGNTDGKLIEEKIGWPAIVKPINGMASHLVKKVTGTEEFVQAVGYIRSNLLNNFAGNYQNPLALPDGLEAKEVDPANSLLVEEFVDGIEYSLEIIVRNGKAEILGIFQKFIVDPASFFECGFTQPGFYWTAEWQQKLQDYVQSAVTATGLDNTVANIEIMDTPNGLYIIEINAGRPGGQLMVMAVRKTRGLDLIHETLALATGQEPLPRTEPEMKGRVTTFTVFPERSGVLKEIKGLDTIKEMKWIRAVVPFCGSGDRVDLRDKEIFVVNFLSDMEGTKAELEQLYLSVRNELEFVFEDEQK